MITVVEKQGLFYLMVDGTVMDVFDRDYEAHATADWLEMVDDEILADIVRGTK